MVEFVSVDRERLRPLGRTSVWILGACLLPTLLTVGILFIAAVGGLIPLDFGFPAAYTAYGLALALSASSLWNVLSERERASVFRFEQPSGRELQVAVLTVPVALAAVPVVAALTAEPGVGVLGGLEYALTPGVVLALAGVGALLAPAAEELLYRGLLLGYLLARYRVVLAAALSLAVFALVVLVTFRVPGMLLFTLLAVVPTLLRLRFDNLTGAWAHRALVNLAVFVLLPALA